MDKGEGKEKENGADERGKGKGRWKEDSLRNVGLMDARTHGHKGDFILCPMQCIALNRQQCIILALRMPNFSQICQRKQKLQRPL